MGDRRRRSPGLPAQARHALGSAARERQARRGSTVLSDVAPGEIMVAQAAREIRDGERVFGGMRLPLMAFVVAKRTHAPNAVGFFELGVVRDEPASELLYTMGDNPNIAGAIWCARTVDLMGLLQRGEVHAGFIGGAEIDVHGNLNTTAIGPERAVLESFHPGTSVERIRAETGWALRVASTVRETERPSEEVLAIIRQYDPQGFWTRRGE